MAESVHFFLESTVPALRDLEKKKIFSPAEIKMIVKKRTDFEYALQRRSTQLIDFLRYIEYEQNLESLRIRRKQRLQIKGKQTISDHFGTQHIIHLYDRACRKFPGDLTLWKEFIRFCIRSKSQRVAAKTFARALQFHPREIRLWLMAASWEWDDNGNATAARTLMQRALRLNGDSLELWLEFFRLEFYFLVKITERQQVLGIDGGSEDKGSAEGINVEELPDAEEGEENSNVDEPVSSSNQSFNEVLQGAIPKAIFRRACTKLDSGSLRIRSKFLDVLRELIGKYPTITKACNSTLDLIYESIEQDFTQNPNALSLLAERPLISSNHSTDLAFINNFKQTVLAYNNFLEKNPDSQEMYVQFARFLQRYIAPDSPVREFAQRCLDRLLSDACDRSLMNEPLFLLWASVNEEPSVVLAKAVEILPQSVKCWMAYIKTAEGNESVVLEYCKKAIQVLKVVPFGIWNLYIDSCVNEGCADAVVIEVYENALRSLSDAHDDAGSVQILSRFLSYLKEHVSISVVRQSYREEDKCPHD